MRIASSAVRQPAVLGRIRYRFQSMTSRIVFFFGSSRSRRRRATVTSSQPEASSEASIDPSVGYLPVPRKSRDRSSTPAITSGPACVSVCTLSAYRLGAGAIELVQVLLQQKGLVATIGQALDRVADRKPLQLVDLDARPE